MKNKRQKSKLDSAQTLTPDKLKLELRLVDQSLAQDSLAEFVKQAWHIVEPAHRFPGTGTST